MAAPVFEAHERSHDVYSGIPWSMRITATDADGSVMAGSLGGGFPAGFSVGDPVAVGGTSTWTLTWIPSLAESSETGEPWIVLFTAMTVPPVDPGTGVAPPSESTTISLFFEAWNRRKHEAVISDSDSIQEHGPMVAVPRAWYRWDDLDQALVVRNLDPVLIGWIRWKLAADDLNLLHEIDDLDFTHFFELHNTGALPVGLPPVLRGMVADARMEVVGGSRGLSTKRVSFIGSAVDAPPLRSLHVPLSNSRGLALGDAIAAFGDRLIIDLAGNLHTLDEDGRIGDQSLGSISGTATGMSEFSDGTLWVNVNLANGRRYYSFDSAFMGGSHDDLVPAPPPVVMPSELHHFALASDGSTNWAIGGTHVFTVGISDGWRDAGLSEAAVSTHARGGPMTAQIMLDSRVISFDQWGIIGRAHDNWPASNTLNGPTEQGARVFIRIPTTMVPNLADYRFAVGSRTIPSSSWVSITPTDPNPEGAALPPGFTYYYVATNFAFNETYKVEFNGEVASVTSTLPLPHGLSNPTAGGWYDDRLVVIDGAQIRVINTESGKAFRQPAYTLDFTDEVRGFTVFRGYPWGLIDLGLRRFAPFSAKVKPDAPAVTIARQGRGYRFSWTPEAGLSYEVEGPHFETMDPSATLAQFDVTGEMAAAEFTQQVYSVYEGIRSDPLEASVAYPPPAPLITASRSTTGGFEVDIVEPPVFGGIDGKTEYRIVTNGVPGTWQAITPAPPEPQDGWPPGTPLFLSTASTLLMVQFRQAVWDRFASMFRYGPETATIQLGARDAPSLAVTPILGAGPSWSLRIRVAGAAGATGAEYRVRTSSGSFGNWTAVAVDTDATFTAAAGTEYVVEARLKYSDGDSNSSSQTALTHPAAPVITSVTFGATHALPFDPRYVDASMRVAFTPTGLDHELRDFRIVGLPVRQGTSSTSPIVHTTHEVSGPGGFITTPYRLRQRNATGWGPSTSFTVTGTTATL